MDMRLNNMFRFNISLSLNKTSAKGIFLPFIASFPFDFYEKEQYNTETSSVDLYLSTLFRLNL